jgi:ribosomal protein S18 acetylase RimI-like enzyme
VTVHLRPAHEGDFDFCADLHFAEMDRAARALGRNHALAAAAFSERWDVTQVRVIMCDGATMGWLQCAQQADAVFLAQLFVAPAFRRRGHATAVLTRLIDEAATAGFAVTLGVVKTNPAVRLYERLGFHVTHEDDRKFYMRRNP